ncbi:hypothetical protein [Marinilactibacillus kalidii]|uniref:hypothetical protein n=1 Tax=Marinilactibacillus kalidii TaxID=2820274 RepID=UPI001ABEAFD4|nr:hypothetical protein [Marinilactibacillus kalidii]
MDEQEWLVSKLKELIENSKDYKQKALLNAVIDMIKEQEKRKEQMQGQLDGTLWSPGNWNQ